MHIDRNEAIARIKAALLARSGKVWSVTGDRGTAWGWIRISVPPRERIDGDMPEDRRVELHALLGLSCHSRVHEQGESISPDSRAWYVLRAEGVRGRDVDGGAEWDADESPGACTALTELPFGVSNPDSLMQPFCVCGRTFDRCDRSRKGCNAARRAFFDSRGAS